MPTSILVPVDILDPDVADAAFARALTLASRDRARLIAVSVVPAWPDDLARVPGDYEPRLQAWVDARRGGQSVTAEIRVGGSITGRLQEAIGEHGVDLVVMASHDPQITDYLIGSNAAHLALHTNCSVLVCRDRSVPPEPWRHVMVPIDLDHPDACDKAMALAQRIAAADGARLTVLSVASMIADDLAGSPPDYQALLDAYLDSLEGTPKPEGELRIAGSVSGEIRFAAQEGDVDLIVMASHTPRLGDYLIGSNAAHVALHTPCSVLVVR